MKSEVPLRIFGLLGPLLSCTESLEAQILPFGWTGNGVPGSILGDELIKSASVQERSWLLHELPTYSLDNVDEIVAYAREEDVQPARQSRQCSVACLAPPVGYDLYCVLEALVDRYLTWKGGKVAVRSARMVELHELGLRLPLGPVVRHAHARAVAAGEQSIRDVLRLPEPVSLLPSGAHGLRSVVRRGLSEGHLHLNSIHATEVGWADHLLKPLSNRPRKFQPADWRLLRLARESARILALAATTSLSQEDPPLGAGILLEIFDRMYFAQRREIMEAAAKNLEEAYRKISALCLPSILSHSSREVRVEEKLRLLRWIDDGCLWHQVVSGERPQKSLSRETLRDREDHVAALHLVTHLALVRAHPGPGQSELPKERNPRAGRAYRFLHSAFFRYLVCRTHHWKKGVQQGRTTGLRHFKTFFDSPQRKGIHSDDYAKAEAVFSRVRNWRGLRVLEGRISPPDKGAHDIFPWLEAYASGAKGGRVEKLGLVVHFIKDHERRAPGDAFSSRTPVRFGDLRRKYRKEAFRLFHLLEAPSLVNPFLVGIDAANLELATPPEVFAPVFRFLREKPFELRDPETPDIDTWRRLEDIRRLIERRRLGMTYHVGEDFRHLLSGLRAIDEVLEFLKPQPGDRIGHGIALGLSPKVWAEQTGFQALVPKLEWLDTLVWVHHLLGAGDDLLGVLQIEDQIERLGREIYQGRYGGIWSESGDALFSISPILLYDAWLLRQLDPDNVDLRNPSDLQHKSDPHQRQELLSFRELNGIDAASWRWNHIESQALRRLRERVGINPPVDLLARYWFSPTIRREGEELILIDMERDKEAWLEVCHKAQIRMQARVASRQIAVEVNPSANRVIGPMNRIAEHHIFDLTLDKKMRLSQRLHVTVNTDNPGTVNTSLAHEYYLLGETLMRQGRPEAEVIKWLEWLRSNGEEYSFVRQLPLPENPAMSRVIDDLKARHRPLHALRDADKIMQALWRWIKDVN